MNVQGMYAQYRVPKNLQQHMLRVAAVAQTMVDAWHGPPIHPSAIIQTCLFHDIAKPVTFDLSKQRQFLTTQAELEKVRSLKQWLMDTYGENEHQAAKKIFSEMDLSPRALTLIDNLEWSYIPQLMEQDDLESLIPIYADMRVGPQGILSLEQRLNDLLSRATVENPQQLHDSGLQLEKRLQTYTHAPLLEIDDDQVKAVIRNQLWTI
jgi:hypothetical protein